MGAASWLINSDILIGYTLALFSFHYSRQRLYRHRLTSKPRHISGKLITIAIGLPKFKKEFKNCIDLIFASLL